MSLRVETGTYIFPALPRAAQEARVSRDPDFCSSVLREVKRSQKTKGGLQARRLNIAVRTGCRGGARLHPGLQSYFFFDFLAFFAFFAFFAFLAIASSFELMEGNATRGMLGGGPASQHPQR
jgi:hypothetical protein